MTQRRPKLLFCIILDSKTSKWEEPSKCEKYYNVNKTFTFTTPMTNLWNYGLHKHFLFTFTEYYKNLLHTFMRKSIVKRSLPHDKNWVFKNLNNSISYKSFNKESSSPFTIVDKVYNSKYWEYKICIRLKIIIDDCIKLHLLNIISKFWRFL